MEYYEQLTFTGKEYQRDKIIEIVKKAIADNTVNGSGEDDIIALDCNDVDHIAEEVAEEVYDLYTSVFDNEIESLERGIKELQDENAALNRECDEYYAQADRLQEKLAQVLMRVDITKEWTLDMAKIEGAKEFAEKLKENSIEINSREFGIMDFVGIDAIDELLEEYKND